MGLVIACTEEPLFCNAKRCCRFRRLRRTQSRSEAFIQIRSDWCSKIVDAKAQGLNPNAVVFGDHNDNQDVLAVDVGHAAYAVRENAYNNADAAEGVEALGQFELIILDGLVALVDSGNKVRASDFSSALDYET